jgi:hypothetical protein
MMTSSDRSTYILSDGIFPREICAIIDSYRLDLLLDRFLRDYLSDILGDRYKGFVDLINWNKVVSACDDKFSEFLRRCNIKCKDDEYIFLSSSFDIDKYNLVNPSMKARIIESTAVSVAGDIVNNIMGNTQSRLASMIGIFPIIDALNIKLFAADLKYLITWLRVALGYKYEYLGYRPTD